MTSSKYWKMSSQQIKKLKKKKVSYRRKGWTDKRIDKERKAGKIRIRAKDVGRPRKHYVRMYYKKPNTLVKTVFTPYKPK